MCCRIIEFREKQVISIKSGCVIGVVGDVEVDTSCGKIRSIIVYGRKRCFGLFGREEDIVVPWDSIEVMGRDSILVNCDFNVNNKHKRRNFLAELWS